MKLKHLACILFLVLGAFATAQVKEPLQSKTRGIWNIDTSEPFSVELPDAYREFLTANKRLVNDPIFLDVICNGGDFHFLGDVDENGFLIPGDTFIVSGYIYPGGTMFAIGPTEAGDFPYGILENGDPEFPDLVIGRWVCWGQVIPTIGGVTAFTNQHFEFDFDPNSPGATTFMSLGEEPYNRAPIMRVIPGGTGDFQYYTGENIQLFISPLNPTGAPNFFMIWPPRQRFLIKQGPQGQ